ncbi:hypothetical protein [Plastoroseomonas hellenica]|uniref:hypothetical protein n=1 Tax=Plastoroseomonas hellenica TaxID=2687306 RepID=UPI002012A138|nr:hypothetical protein [Plastoroseomonas hellenica]MBR0644522.1 hypothetical protein [Plastoroseomonas hellenica]
MPRVFGVAVTRVEGRGAADFFSAAVGALGVAALRVAAGFAALAVAGFFVAASAFGARFGAGFGRGISASPVVGGLALGVRAMEASCRS